MNRIMDFANNVYVLRDLKRYNNTTKIKDESVAEHSAFVTLIVVQLHRYYEFDLKKAMIMAIAHDLSEIYVTDIPHNVKRDFPAIKKAIKDAEVEVVSKHFGDFIARYFIEFESQDTTEAKIVNYADVISCIQYSGAEVKLGNSGYMKEVYESSLKRAEIILDELKTLERDIV